MIYSFPSFEPVHCSMSSSNCCFLSCKQVYQDPGKVVLGIEDQFQFSSVQSLSCVQLFATPWTAAHHGSLSITNSCSLLKLMSIESVMPSISFSVIFFSYCPQSFLASKCFQRSQLFASSGQSTGVSASVSVLPMNTQD